MQSTNDLNDAINLLYTLVLVLVFVVYNRRREAQIKYPNPDDDVRENIINYEDEGGGEDDMTAFDITPLQIPVGDGTSAAAAAAAQQQHLANMSTLQRAKYQKSCTLKIINRSKTAYN